MTTRYRLSPPALDRLAQLVGPDGTATAEEVARALSEATTSRTTVAMSDNADEPDADLVAAYLAATGIVEDADEPRTYSGLSEEDRLYCDYLHALGVDVRDAVTLELR